MQATGKIWTYATYSLFQVLWKLRGFTTTSLSLNHQNLEIINAIQQTISEFVNWQALTGWLHGQLFFILHFFRQIFLNSEKITKLIKLYKQ